MKRFKSPNAYAIAIEAQRPPVAQETTRDDDLPLSVSELSLILGWGRSKIEKLRKAGVIPFHQIGTSYPYYYLAEVKEALKNASAGSTGTDSNEAN